MSRTTYRVSIDCDKTDKPVEFTFSPLADETDHMSAAVDHIARLTGNDHECFGLPILREIDR